MGANSTIYVSRDKAIQYIIRKLFNLNDEELAEMMDTLLYERLYNVRIGDYEENDDCILEE